MPTQQFSAGETVTAVMHLGVSPSHYSETYCGPLVLGHFGEGGGGEVWIEQEGRRLLIPAAHIAAFVRELKRAHAIAAEVAKS